MGRPAAIMHCPTVSWHYRVVRMGLRAVTAARKPARWIELTLDRLVHVAELLDQPDCPSAHIVGNSAGGYLGQLAMNQGERCAA